MNKKPTKRFIEKYCNFCKKKHKYRLEYNWIEPCDEPEFEHEGYWSVSEYWLKKDYIDMLKHNIKQTTYYIKRTEKQREELKNIEPPKSNPYSPLIPIYVDPLIVDVHILLRYRLIRDLEIVKLNKALKNKKQKGEDLIGK